jgi:uncharacterized protein YjbJ (UPF0337 family)
MFQVIFDRPLKLKGANETAWAQFKAHLDKAGGEVKDAVERMTTKFKQ